MRSIYFTVTILCAFLLSSFTTNNTIPPNDTTPLISNVTPDFKSNIYVKNNCYKKISILVWYEYSNNDWTIKDWIDIDPGQTVYVASAKRSSVLIHAQTISPPQRILPLLGQNGDNDAQHKGTNYQFKKYDIYSNNDKTITVDCIDLKLANDLAATNKTVSNSKGVGLYTKDNYGGASKALGVGSWDYNKLGIPNDKLSSLKIPTGWSITLYKDYNFKGSDIKYTSNKNVLPPTFQNSISSVVVKNNNTYKDPSLNSGEVGGGSGGINPGGVNKSNIYKVHVKNNCIQPITVYFHKRVNGTTTNQWESVGGHVVNPDKEFYAEDDDNGIIYYAAEMGPLKWPAPGATGNRTWSFGGQQYEFTKFDMTPMGYGKRVITLNCPTQKAEANKRKALKNVESGIGVGLFENGNYGGKTKILPEGKYKNMNDINFSGSKLGSFIIPEGWSVTVYSLPYLEGSSETFTGKIPSLQLNWRNSVYSIEVKNNNANKSNKVSINSNTKPNENKTEVSSTRNTGKTERISLNLRSGKPFVVEVSSILSKEDAWSRARSVISPNGFMKRDVDNTFHTLTTDWQAFPRLNNTLRVKLILERLGSDEYPEYSVSFMSEESGVKDTSVYEDVKFRPTQMLPVECDKVLSDLQRKLGDR